MKSSIKKIHFLLFIFLMTLFFCGCHHPFDRFPAEHPEPWTPSDIESMLGGEDPMEGFNRSMFSCTDFLMTYGADPLGRVYTSIFPRPFIKHFDNVCVNLEYPARAVSSLLQAEWQAAGTESVRFLANTTLGIAGIFDVAQSWWYIPPAEADFGQAFAAWGIGSGHTFILPVASSMNGRDLLGMLFDTAFDLKTYIPYAGYATFLNRMTVAQHGYASIVADAVDPYKNYRQMMLIRRELQLRMWFYKEAQRQLAEYKRLAEEREAGNPPEPPAEWIPPARPAHLPFGNYAGLKNFFPQGSETDSLRVMLFQPRRDRDWWYMPLSIFNSDFLQAGKKLDVELLPERPGLRYCFWEAPEKPDTPDTPPAAEKLVILLPGIGGVYTNATLIALAEQFNNAGSMVVTVDSSFNWNFVVADSECRLPGYLPDDAERVRNAIAAIIADLREKERIKQPEIILCGYSMGGIQTLKIAELENISRKIGIKRFIAVNPPVSLESALKKIDSLVAGSAGWSKEEMREKLVNTAGNMLLKMADRYPIPGAEDEIEEFRKFILPLDEETAKVAAGLFLKMSMREMLFAVHRERNLTGFPEYQWGSRSELYQAIDRMTFEDYAKKLLAPSYPEYSVKELFANSHLRSMEQFLRTSPEIRVFHTADDFLADDSEKQWLDSVLKERITWFSNGGHLGNLYYKQVLDTIVAAGN